MNGTWISDEELRTTGMVLIRHGVARPPKGSVLLTAYERARKRLRRLDKQFQDETGFTFNQLKEALLRLREGGASPEEGTVLSDALARLFDWMPRIEAVNTKSGMVVSDEQLKEILLMLAECGAPKPPSGTVLGEALDRFTNPSGRDLSADESQSADAEP